MSYGTVFYIPRTQVKGKVLAPNSSKEETKWQPCTHETVCVNTVTETRCPGKTPSGNLLEARHSPKYFSFQNPLWGNPPWMVFPDKCCPQGLHSWAALTCHPAGTAPSLALYIWVLEEAGQWTQKCRASFSAASWHSWGDSWEEFEDENNGHKWFH